MARLTPTERQALWSEFSSEASGFRELIPLNKSETRSAIDSLDTKLDTFIDGLDVPPASPLAQFSLKQRLRMIRNNVTKRLRKF